MVCILEEVMKFDPPSSWNSQPEAAPENVRPEGEPAPTEIPKPANDVVYLLQTIVERLSMIEARVEEVEKSVSDIDRIISAE